MLPRTSTPVVFALTNALHRSGFRGGVDAIRLTLIAVLCEGHLLIEDVPGVGKTRLAKGISQALGFGRHTRIQFTPDLLPSDITGLSMYNQARGAFEFKRGPIFAQLVLCDEINRGTPKTQSALLEAMAERQVTVDGTTYHLDAPFLVMATQNPVEYEGTFPLPEAQLDRFLVTARLGYPEEEDEVQLALGAQLHYEPVPSVLDPAAITQLRAQLEEVRVGRDIAAYARALSQASRELEPVELGLSPRATIALVAAARGNAFLNGATFVSPDDIKAVFPAVARHRLKVSAAARMRNVNAEALIEELLHRVSVPGTMTALAGGERRRA
jgi:MoxR-like ATPase